jgi:AraC-like DNA-binding protein
MAFAIDLIENKDSISDISLLLGYNDIAAFSNAFKNHFEFSPKKYK